jgi:hypothetical protein
MKITITIKEMIVALEEAEALLTAEDPQPRNRRRRRTAEEIASDAAENQPATNNDSNAAFA